MMGGLIDCVSESIHWLKKIHYIYPGFELYYRLPHSLMVAECLFVELREGESCERGHAFMLISVGIFGWCTEEIKHGKRTSWPFRTCFCV